MPDHTGLFIVLEGADGSGKTTQFSLLTQRLKAIGHDVVTFDFPQYSSPSSYFIKKYLNGEYGEATSLSPYTASLFYALDRFEASSKIFEALKGGKIVLANRYVGSNMAHQGSKFGTESEQRGFFVWAESLEFQLLGIPRPTINIYLKVPPKISYELIAKKARRDYTEKIRDGHESNLSHLEKTAATYDLLTKLFPKDFIEIECGKNNQILDIPQISDLIWSAVSPLLPSNPPNPAKSITIKLNHRKYIETPPAKPEMVKKPVLLKKSPKVSQPKLEIDDVSLLATSSLVGLNVLGEQQDNKWHKSKKLSGCSYFIPSELPSYLKTQYLDTIDTIAREYIAMKNRTMTVLKSRVNKLEQTELLIALQNVIPLCAFCTLRLSPDHTLVSQVIENLSASSPKLSETKVILSRLTSSTSQEPIKVDQPSELDINPPQKLEDIINQLAKNRPPQNLPGDAYSPKLVSHWPHNEFDLLIAGQASSSESKRKIIQELDEMSYTQKNEKLRQLILGHPEHILSEIYYDWECVTDRTTINFLTSNDLIGDVKNQVLSLRYGFEIPEIIEKYGLTDQYLKCFELSASLYDRLKSANLEHLAAYGALMGHRSRWQFKTSAAQWIKYVNQSKQPIQLFDTKIISMEESIMEVHPIISEIILSREKESSPSK